MVSPFSAETEQNKYNAAGQEGLFRSVRPAVFRVLKAAAVLSLFLFSMDPGRSFADIYRYKDENGVLHFTNVKSDTRYILYIKEARENPDAFIKKYDSIISQASDKFSLEPSLVKAVIKAESGFDHKAVSSRGARGLMQLMPGTAEEMAVDDPHNPEQNIFGGTRYLSKLLERFNSDVELALAAYNAGPDKVDKYKGVPPYEETRTFIKRVLDYYRQYKAAR